MQHLQRIAPSLGYTDAGMKAPAGIKAGTERIATIVTGPPAAGKSTVANELARSTRAALVDPDVIKKSIMEFRGGLGANAVHEESSELTKKWLKAHVEKGQNIVMPRTGDNAQKLVSQIDVLRKAGYKVDVVRVHVPPDVSMTRMLRRFDRTGRLVSPDFVKSIGNKPAQALEVVRNLGIAKVSTVDLSADKPPKPPASGLKAALVGKDPRRLQSLTKLGGRAALVGIGILAAAKVYELATRQPADTAATPKTAPKSSYTKADGTTSTKQYTDAQIAQFMARRKD